MLDEAGCLPADFDEAAICTIHSFCRSLLAEYAFENRVPMQTEIAASGREAVRRAILGTLRSQRYRDEREGDFAELMAAAGFDAAKLAADGAKVGGAVAEIKNLDSMKGKNPIALTAAMKEPTAEVNTIKSQLADAVKACKYWLDLNKQDEKAQKFMKDYPIE